MKKLLSIALLASLGFSATITVMPYGAYVDYSNKALKDNAIIGGLYFSYFDSPFKIELDPEYTHITYKYNIPNWNQEDLTGVFHYYEGYNWDFKVGMHGIFVNQIGNNDKYDKVFFGGIKYYKYLKYNMGIDYYYSDYKNFYVNQITPEIGFDFGDYYSMLGLFYTEIKLDYIKLSENDSFNRKNYTDVDLKIQNYHQGPCMVELFGSLGKNAYKVANNGFVVYNTGEEYKYNAGININFYLSKSLSVKIGFSRSKYTLQNSNEDVFSNTYVASISQSF